MVKEPRPGCVKTRLGRSIGMVEAAWWYRHQSLGLIRRLRDRRWQMILAVTPDTGGLNSRIWPGDLVRWPQGGGDLGQRMAGIFRALPGGPVLIIGSDIPAISKRDVVSGFKTLAAHDAVFGPATDGGYWMVGLKRVAAVPAGIFANVRWSTRHALADSINSLRGYRIALTDCHSDVDTVDDL